MVWAKLLFRGHAWEPSRLEKQRLRKAGRAFIHGQGHPYGRNMGYLTVQPVRSRAGRSSSGQPPFLLRQLELVRSAWRGALVPGGCPWAADAIRSASPDVCEA